MTPKASGVHGIELKVKAGLLDGILNRLVKGDIRSGDRSAVVHEMSAQSPAVLGAKASGVPLRPTRFIEQPIGLSEVEPPWGGTAATLSVAKPSALDPPNSAATAKASDGHARGATSLTQADGCRPRAFSRPLQKADKACRNIYGSGCPRPRHLRRRA